MNKTLKPRRRFFVFLLIVVPVLFFIGWSQASLNLSFIRPREPAQAILLFTLSAFVFLTFIIFSLILSRNLLKLYLEKRREQLGSEFKIKMVTAFLGLSVLPVIVLFLFAYGLMNRSLDKWFLIPFNAVRYDAEVLQEELQRVTQRETQHAVNNLISKPLFINAVKQENSHDLQQLMKSAITEFDLDYIACYSINGELITELRSNVSSIENFANEISSKDLKKFIKEGSVIWRSPEGLRKFIAAANVTDLNGLRVGKLILFQSWPVNVEHAGVEIAREVQNYDNLSQQHKFFRRMYLSVLSLLTLLILFAATWFALFLSKQVTVPIQSLVEATREVSRGNLAFQVEMKAGDELGQLIHSFNSMTTRLRKANQDLEEQAKYLETILLNIPAGVVSIDHEGQVREINQNLKQMLGTERTEKAKDLKTLFTKGEAKVIASLLRRASRQGVTARQLELELKGEKVVVSLTISAIGPDQGKLGYVLVLEDLTEMLRIQKSAAWREVAQRIAHEIKNPLTPIQLSAERISRLLKKNKSREFSKQTLESLVDSGKMISQEVGTLKSLVDEFSQFARFPTAQPVPSDINFVINNALAVFHGRLTGIEIHLDLATKIPNINIDPDQIKRALINLVDNAAEALEHSMVREILIQTVYDPERETIEIIVSDSGPGVHPPMKEKLFLPYFSTKQHGTGLGLAIVGRIVSEHNGTIRVEENKPTGARFIVELPFETQGIPGVTLGTKARDAIAS